MQVREKLREYLGLDPALCLRGDPAVLLQRLTQLSAGLHGQRRLCVLQGVHRALPKWALRGQLVGAYFLPLGGLLTGLARLLQQQGDLGLIVSARVRRRDVCAVPSLGQCGGGTGCIAGEQVVSAGLVALNAPYQRGKPVPQNSSGHSAPDGGVRDVDRAVWPDAGDGN